MSAAGGFQVWRGRLERLGRRADRAAAAVAWLRTVAFLTATATAAAALPFAEHATALRWSSLGCVLVFAAGLALHRRPQRCARLVQGMLAALDREVVRADGRFRELERTGEGLVEDCPFAADLALFGRWSLFQWLSRCGTPFGERRLARLLAAGSPAEDVPGRQRAVRELARLPGLRLRLQAEAEWAALEGPPPSVLASPPARASLHEGRPWLAPAATGLVALTWLQGSLAWVTGWPTAFWPCLLLQVLAVALSHRRLETEYLALLPHERSVLAWGRMFAVIERRGFQAPLLGRLRAVLRPGEAGSASSALRRLSRLLASLNLRLNMLHPLVNAALLWDLRHTRRLHRWRSAHSRAIGTWFEALAELEVLSSLGGHAAVLGSGSFPELLGGNDGPAWAGRGVVHPLLPVDVAVPNDVALADAGALVLLTGSNMSGKSTLLRAVGLNTVLAFAGGAVHARALTLRAARLVTSIHATDALDAGVSLFHAEVRRLAELLRHVGEAERDDAVLPVLYLIDEILRGTNTRERLVASRAIIRRLAGSTSWGMVTSHEVSLAELAGELPSLDNRHFRETVVDGRMTFDYRLRPGAVTTSNALAILRQEGLDLDLDGERS